MYKFTLAATLVCLSIISKGQRIPVPLNVLKAYHNHTRNDDGTPGKNYWQNHSNYKIDVELLPDSSILMGRETVIYDNESPDTLKQLVIRLYQNIFKSGNPRQFGVNPADLHSGIILDSIKIDNYSINPETDPSVKKTYTNLILPLNRPLLHGQTATLYIKWSFHYPQHTNIRMGKYKNGSILMAYFYPQIAVYDDVDGWDLSDYLGVAEFYNDFSDYSVTIKAPQDYPVWGNGNSINYQQVFKDSILQNLKLSMSSDTVINIISPETQNDKIFKTGSDWHIWKFTAENISDFVFAAASHYNWDASSILVDSSLDKRCQIFTLYPDGAPNYQEVTKIAGSSVAYLSGNLPGVAYPYPRVTVFCNGTENGGMEFPGMVNDGAPEKLANTVGLTFHEISHSYFPFYMGINERKYAWMDEGWATMLPAEVVNLYDSTFDYNAWVVKSYLKTAGTEYDTPPMVLSSMINPPSYRNASYYRPAVAYAMLLDFLGKEKFKLALQAYMKRWNGKHPLPYDFFNTFDNVTGENLDWFWKPWFFDFAYPDLQIAGAELKGGYVLIHVLNKGGIPLPVSLKMVYADGLKKTFYQSCEIWKDGQKEHILKIKSKSLPQTITLGNRYIPDIDSSDNTFSTR